jgi:hypothetical protein
VPRSPGAGLDDGEAAADVGSAAARSPGPVSPSAATLQAADRSRSADATGIVRARTLLLVLAGGFRSGEAIGAGA